MAMKKLFLGWKFDMRRISRRSSHTSVGNKALNSAAPAEDR
jgi:hypothetical protein